MARAVLAQLVLLLATIAQAGEFYVFTNRYDDVQVSQAWEDKQFAVGAVTTSAVSPYAASELVPVQSPPIELPYIVLTDDNGAGYGVIVDGGDLLTVLDHASPRPSKAIIRQRIQQARADRAALRQNARTVRTNMANLATSSTTAASQGQQIEELRKAVRDLAAIIRKQLKDNEP